MSGSYFCYLNKNGLNYYNQEYENVYQYHNQQYCLDNGTDFLTSLAVKLCVEIALHILQQDEKNHYSEY